MATAARAHIEALLRARKLDTTLTSARPFDTADDEYVCATGIAPLDATLGGGFARGQLSEVVGPRSSGRTSVILSALAAAASRGELVALVDTFDTFDPSSARTCGLDLTRLLWVRGRARPVGARTPDTAVREAHALNVSKDGYRTSDSWHIQSIDRALKAFSLILQAGGFGLVVLDLADATCTAIRQLPFTTWFRLQRPIEGSPTACVLLASEPVARSAGGVTIALRRIERDGSKSWDALFTGFDAEARIGRARGVADSCMFACAAAV